MFSKIKEFIKNNSFLNNAIITILYFYLKFVYATSKIEFKNKQQLDELNASKKPFILASFHQRLALIPYIWQYKTGRHPTILASNHNDGRKIAQILEKFKMKPIYGSTGKKGVKAALKLVKQLQQGGVVAITPDGPRGPNMVVSDGIITIGKLASKRLGQDIQIVPITYAIKHRILFNSWDRFITPLPFSKIILSIGQLIIINKKQNKTKRLELENEMLRITNEADKSLGLKLTIPNQGHNQKYYEKTSSNV